jgi:hypothetical protein
LSRVYVERKPGHDNAITQKKTSDFWNKFIDPHKPAAEIQEKVFSTPSCAVLV